MDNIQLWGFFYHIVNFYIGDQPLWQKKHMIIKPITKVPLILLANESKLPQKDLEVKNYQFVFQFNVFVISLFPWNMFLRAVNGQVRQAAREIQVKAMKELVEWSHDLTMGPGTSTFKYILIQIIQMIPDRPLLDVSKSIPGRGA